MQHDGLTRRCNSQLQFARLCREAGNEVRHFDPLVWPDEWPGAAAATEGAAIAVLLVEHGQVLSELDAEGMTQLHGRRGGRTITSRGLAEVRAEHTLWMAGPARLSRIELPVMSGR